MLLCIAMNVSDALRGVQGAWMYLADPRLRQMPLYRMTMGTADVSASLRIVLKAVAVYGALLAILWASARIMRDRPGHGRQVCIVMVIIAFIVFPMINLNIWRESLRGLTILMPLIAVGTFVFAIRDRLPRRILQTTIAIFASFLLAKIILNVRSYHYG